MFLPNVQRSVSLVSFCTLNTSVNLTSPFTFFRRISGSIIVSLGHPIAGILASLFFTRLSFVPHGVIPVCSFMLSGLCQPPFASLLT
jgi:hypothetical protein